MPVVYRIIKYEGTEEALEGQIDDSVAEGFIYNPRTNVTITIKDRNDDPNEQGFFDSCILSSHGMVRKKDLRTPQCQEQDQ